MSKNLRPEHREIRQELNVLYRRYLNSDSESEKEKVRKIIVKVRVKLNKFELIDFYGQKK